MKKFTKELVDKFARDLLISLTEEENKMVLEEFEMIEENMEKINQFADLNKIEAMTHPFPVEVSLRLDEVKDELQTEEVLQNASKKTMEEVVIPKVVEE